MALSIISIVRLVVFGVVLAFSLIVLGVGAHILAVINVVPNPITIDYINLGIAISALTILTMVPLLVISLLRKGAFLNYIAVEFTCLSILWILWIASAGFATDQLNLLGYSSSCNFVFIVGTNTIDCHEPLIVQGFGWMNWIILFGYTILILVLAIIQHSRGNPVWAKSVNEVDLFAPAAPGNYEKPAVGYPPQQQPQQQQAYAPQGYQPQPAGYPPPQLPSVANYTTAPMQQPSPVTNYTITPPPMQQASLPVGSVYPEV